MHCVTALASKRALVSAVWASLLVSGVPASLPVLVAASSLGLRTDVPPQPLAAPIAPSSAVLNQSVPRRVRMATIQARTVLARKIRAIQRRPGSVCAISVRTRARALVSERPERSRLEYAVSDRWRSWRGLAVCAPSGALGADGVRRALSRATMRGHALRSRRVAATRAARFGDLSQSVGGVTDPSPDIGARWRRRPAVACDRAAPTVASAEC